MLPEKNSYRIEFVRLCNAAFSPQMCDKDRRRYWTEVLEPVWGRLSEYWDLVKGLPRDRWEATILKALKYAKPPAIWREDARQAKMKKSGYDRVNTKAFWQRQTFGPASEVRRIDPSTYKESDE